MDESKAIDECRDALETLLKNPERKLVNFLVSEGFMQASLREDLLNPRSILTGAEKGGKAVDAIYEAVGRDKELFHKLVAWFGNEKYYQGMAEKLSSKVGGGGSGGVSQQHTAPGIPPARPVYSSTSPPTFEDYAQRVNPQDLSKEIDRKDTDHQLFEIAEVLRDWERLAPWLGLSEQQIIDIRDHPTRRPQLKRRDALSEWKRMYSFQATYGALLKVCVERGETDCARKIVELLGGSMDGGGAQYTPTPQAAPQGPGAYYSNQPQQQYPQTANHPPHGAEYHQAPPTDPPGSGSIVNKEEFSEDFTPQQLYTWLRLNQVPVADCEKIQSQEIGGIAFKLITDDNGWEEFGVTKTAIKIINLRIKKLLANQGGGAPAQSAPVQQAPPPQQQAPPPQPHAGNVLAQIDGTTQLGTQHQAVLQGLITDLSPEDVTNLGQTLGIARSRLTKCSGGSIHGEMVHTWLIGADQSRTVNPVPTWRGYAAALDTIGQGGIVAKIKTEHPA